MVTGGPRGAAGLALPGAQVSESLGAETMARAYVSQVGKAGAFAQAGAELRVLYVLPRNPGTVTWRSSSVLHPNAVAMEGLEPFTAVFSLPVVAADYRQNGDAALPLEKTPFQFAPEQPRGRLRWLNSYTVSFVPTDPWPCDAIFEVVWNMNLTSSLGATIQGAHAFPRIALVTPMLSMQTVRIVSPTASAATSGRWNPYWREDTRIRMLGDAAPSYLKEMLEKPLVARFNATTFRSNASYAELPPDNSFYLVFNHGTCHVNFELLADAFDVRKARPKGSATDAHMLEDELRAEEAEKISFKTEPCEQDWDWGLPESEGVRANRGPREDELELHLSRGYRNEYGPCAKVSVHGLEGEKNYILRIPVNVTLHEGGGKSKFEWAAAVKGIEPFRINLHGSHLLTETFHAAFDEKGEWQLDHKRPKPSGRSKAFRVEAPKLRQRHGVSFIDDYSATLGASAGNIVNALPFFGRRNLDVFLPYGMDPEVTEETLEGLIAVHTLPVPAWLFECGSEHSFDCVPNAKQIKAINDPNAVPPEGGWSEKDRRWAEILRVHQQGYQDRKMLSARVYRRGTDVLRIVVPELEPDRYYEISIAGSEKVKDLFGQELLSSRTAFFTSTKENSFHLASWPLMTIDPNALEVGALEGLPVVSKGASAYADGHYGDGPPGFDDNDSDARRLPLRTAMWEVRNADEMSKALGLIAGHQQETSMLRPTIPERGDEDQFAGRYAGLSSTVYARNDPNSTVAYVQHAMPHGGNITQGAYLLRTCCHYVEDAPDPDYVYFNTIFKGRRRQLMGRRGLLRWRSPDSLNRQYVEGIMRRIDATVLTVTDVMSFVTIGSDKAHALVLKSNDMEWEVTEKAEVTIWGMPDILRKGKMHPISEVHTNKTSGHGQGELQNYESFRDGDSHAVGITVTPKHFKGDGGWGTAPFMNYIFDANLRTLRSGWVKGMHAVLHSDREIYRSGEIVHCFGYVFSGEAVLRHIEVPEHWAPTTDSSGRRAATTELAAATTTTDFYLEMEWDRAKGTKVQVPVFVNGATGAFSAYLHVPITFQHDRMRITLNYQTGFHYDVQSYVKLTKLVDSYQEAVQRGEGPLAFLHEETFDGAAGGVAAAEEVRESESSSKSAELDAAYSAYMQQVEQAMRLVEERDRIQAARDSSVKTKTGKVVEGGALVISVLPRALGVPNPYLDIGFGSRNNDAIAFFADEPVKVNFRAGGLNLRHLEMSEVFADVKVLRSLSARASDPTENEVVGVKDVYKVVHHEVHALSLDEFAAAQVVVDVMSKAQDGDMLQVQAALKPTTKQRIERNHTVMMRPRPERVDLLLSTNNPVPHVPFGVAVEVFNTETQRVETESLPVTVTFAAQGERSHSCTFKTISLAGVKDRPSFAQCRLRMEKPIVYELEACVQTRIGGRRCEKRFLGRDYTKTPVDLSDVTNAKRSCQMSHSLVKLGSEARVLVDYFHLGGAALIAWGDRRKSKSQMVSMDAMKMDGGLAELKFGPITADECAEGCDVMVTVAVPRQDDGTLSPFVGAIDKTVPQSATFEPRSALAYNCSTEIFALDEDIRHTGITRQILDVRVTASSDVVKGGGKVLVQVDINPGEGRDGKESDEEDEEKDAGEKDSTPSANGTIVFVVADTRFVSKEELNRKGTPEELIPRERERLQLFQAFASTEFAADPKALDAVVAAIERRASSNPFEVASARDFALGRTGLGDFNETLAVDMEEDQYFREGMADCLTSSPYGCSNWGIPQPDAAERAWALEVYNNVHVHGNRVPYKQIRELMKEEAETNVHRAGTIFVLKREIAFNQKSMDFEFTIPPTFSGKLAVRAFVSLPEGPDGRRDKGHRVPHYGYGATMIEAPMPGNSRLTVDLPRHVRTGDHFYVRGILETGYKKGTFEVAIDVKGSGLELKGKAVQSVTANGPYHFHISAAANVQGPAMITLTAKNSKYGDMVVSGPHTVHVYHRTLRNLVMDALPVPVSSGGNPGAELQKLPVFGRDIEGGMYVAAGASSFPALAVFVSHALQRPQIVSAEWLLCAMQAAAVARSRQLNGRLELHGVVADPEALDSILHSTARTLLRFTSKNGGLRSVLLPNMNEGRIDLQLNAFAVVMLDSLEEMEGVEVPAAIQLARNDWIEAMQVEVAKRVVGCHIGGYMHASVDYAGMWTRSKRNADEVAGNITEGRVFRDCRQVLADDLTAVRVALGYDWSPPDMGEDMREAIAFIDNEGPRTELAHLTTFSIGGMLLSFMRYSKKRNVLINRRVVETLLQILTSRLADGDAGKAWFKEVEDRPHSAGHVSNAFALLAMLEVAQWRKDVFGSSAVEHARSFLPKLGKVALHLSSTPAHDHHDISSLDWLEVGVSTAAIVRFEEAMQDKQGGAKLEARMDGNIVAKADLAEGERKTSMRFVPWRDLGLDTGEVRHKGSGSVLLYAHGNAPVYAAVGYSFSPRPVTKTLARGGLAIQRLVQPIREGRVDVTEADTTLLQQGDVVLVTIQVTSTRYLHNGVEVLEPVIGAFASIVPETSSFCDPESEYVPAGLKMDLSPDCPVSSYEFGHIRVLWQSFRAGTKEFRYRAVVSHAGAFHHGAAVARARGFGSAYAVAGERRVESASPHASSQRAKVPMVGLRDQMHRCPHETFKPSIIDRSVKLRDHSPVPGTGQYEHADSVDCRDLGTCDVRTGKCVCDDGYTGEMCETAVEVGEGAAGDDDGFVDAFEARKSEGTSLRFLAEGIVFLAIAGSLPAAVYMYKAYSAARKIS